MTTTDNRKPETAAQAALWDVVKAKYVADGLCHACAAKAAWGHQLGWGYRSNRNWPEVDRVIKPPCADCQPVVASFPLPTVKGSPWRRWPRGDRRPVGVVHSISADQHTSNGLDNLRDAA